MLLIDWIIVGLLILNILIAIVSLIGLYALCSRPILKE